MFGRKRGAMRIAAAGAAFAVALIFAACGGGGSPTENAGSDPAASEASQSPAAQQDVGTPVAVTVGETDVSHQYMQLDVTSVPAGLVTFTITNDGVKTHEFVILETPAAANELQMEGDEVTEDAYTGVDEAEGIEPGATTTLTVDLQPGHYALICNLKGHFRMGMYNDFEVR